MFFSRALHLQVCPAKNNALWQAPFESTEWSGPSESTACVSHRGTKSLRASMREVSDAVGVGCMCNGRPGFCRPYQGARP